jgi:hypothetical protein
VGLEPRALITISPNWPPDDRRIMLSALRDVLLQPILSSTLRDARRASDNLPDIGFLRPHGMEALRCGNIGLGLSLELVHSV